ncbi:MAG: GTPase HflX [Alphaproteobacteria bacterium]|nr:GTPase HflX [Alphaproteobacteria bacterium]
MTTNGSTSTSDGRPSGRCIVLHPALKTARDGARSPEALLAEASSLAGAVDLRVEHAEVIRIQQPRPATLIGIGVVERLAGLIAEREIEVVVMDTTLSPVQQRNLEKAWKTKVIDRTGLILEIFGARARTAEGRLQVELASLTYQRSRLVRTWTHLERQRGGFGFLSGPGESQLEADKRMLGERIVRLKADLENVRRTRGLQRRARKRVPYPVVALVGYTNAGKSTLFNRLVHARVLAADMLFATLDPTMRALELPSGRKVILSDTVGFISDLPTHLVAAFRATLEEVQEADIVVHVRDIAHPETAAQAQDVCGVLADLGLPTTTEAGLVEVLNKIDLIDDEPRATILNQAARDPNVVALSALSGEGCDRLLERIDARLKAAREVVELTLPHSDGAGLAWLYRHGEVLARRDEEGGIRLTVGLDPADRARFDASHRINSAN